jgi:hypothetical protein
VPWCRCCWKNVNPFPVTVRTWRYIKRIPNSARYEPEVSSEKSTERKSGVGSCGVRTGLNSPLPRNPKKNKLCRSPGRSRGTVSGPEIGPNNSHVTTATHHILAFLVQLPVCADTSWSLWKGFQGNGFCCEVGLLGVYDSSGSVAGTCVAASATSGYTAGVIVSIPRNKSAIPFQCYKITDQSLALY